MSVTQRAAALPARTRAPKALSHPIGRRRFGVAPISGGTAGLVTPPVPGCSTFEREFDNRSPFSAALLTVPLPAIADMIGGPFALASVGVRMGRHTSHAGDQSGADNRSADCQISSAMRLRCLGKIVALHGRSLPADRSLRSFDFLINPVSRCRNSDVVPKGSPLWVFTQKCGRWFLDCGRELHPAAGGDPVSADKLAAAISPSVM